MKSSTIQLVKLEPSDGYYLTQANIQEGEERIFSDSIFLGINDSEENWVEWSEEEMNAFLDNVEVGEKHSNEY